jgi:hypothetical protein
MAGESHVQYDRIAIELIRRCVRENWAEVHGRYAANDRSCVIQCAPLGRWARITRCWIIRDRLL